MQVGVPPSSVVPACGVSHQAVRALPTPVTPCERSRRANARRAPAAPSGAWRRTSSRVGVAGAHQALCAAALRGRARPPPLRARTRAAVCLLRPDAFPASGPQWSEGAPPWPRGARAGPRCA